MAPLRLARSYPAWPAAVLSLACAAQPAAPPKAVPADDAAPAAPAARAKPPGFSGHAKHPLPRDIVRYHAHSYRGVRVDDGTSLSPQALLDALASYDAICFGESHSDPAHHWAQWTTLLDLLPRQRPLALGLEMFQRPFQAPLTEYERGRIDEREMLERTEYATRWGFDYSLYRPLLDTAARADTTLLALNAPRELTKAVARGGPSSLSAAERAQLPELDFASRPHRAYFDDAMGGHPLGDMNVEDFYAAQVLWDETMADVAATWLGASSVDTPPRQILIVAGAGHCHHEAIPARLKRRLPTVTPVSITAVLESELSQGLEQARGHGRFDLLWVMQGPPPEEVPPQPTAQRH